jgi:hypothetical protein
MPRPNEESLELQEEAQDALQPEKLLIEVDGKDTWVNAYTLGNAAKLVGKTYKGFQKILERQEKEGRKVQLYKPQIGKGTYILEDALKDLMRARPVED